MIKVEKSRYMRICLTLLAAGALLFSTLFVYFIGWEFELSTFGICIGIIVAEVLALFILCFALIKSNKYYYLITPESVRMFKNEQELFVMSNTDIIKINYARFAWIFLAQMGAGYLHMEYTDATGNIKPTISCPNRKKIYSISMSPKQAKQIAAILNKELQP